MIDFKKLSEPLPISSIDFRVQSINKGGYATILAYKDARVDMNRLDEICWVENWKREHSRDNKNCMVSIWDESKSVWVSKEDTGTESNTEEEKGLASDSFKRACFNWGIGRELYDYPVISVKLNEDEYEKKNDKCYATYNLKIKEWKWTSEFTNWKITSLIAHDNKWALRFSMWNKVEPKNTTNTTTEKNWLNFNVLKKAIDSWTDTEVLLTQWILENKYDLSGAMRQCLRTYCDSGELIAPEYKK